MRKLLMFLAVLVTSLGVLGGAASAVSAPAPYCGIRWGSLPKSELSYTHTSAFITTLRAGRHSCFDRLVIDLGPQQSGVPHVSKFGYQISYGGPPLDAEHFGKPIPFAGGAFLNVVVNATVADDMYPGYRPTARLHAVNVTGFRTLRQVAVLGSYEGGTELAIGVRARLPYRVFHLAGPGAGSRLVIDVAHRW